MRAIIKRELKNYLKNPLLWLGLLVITVMLYQDLSPYLQLRYFEQMPGELSLEELSDADIMQGYVPSTQERQYADSFAEIRRQLVEEIGEPEAEADRILKEPMEKGMSENEIIDYMSRHNFHNVYYIFKMREIHQAEPEEANAYIAGRLEEKPYTFYAAKKFVDLAGVYMSFFSMILLAFLFMRDTRRDTYELLHTKPVSAFGYVGGKLLGGFLSMAFVLALLNVVFTVLFVYHGGQAGFPVSIWDLTLASIVYILPNMLMLVSVYAIVSLIFKNSLPAVPMLLLYIIYSNMGSVGPDGHYGYYAKLMAIVVRFPGMLLETETPFKVIVSQLLLLLASGALLAGAVRIWKRRRVY